MSESTPAETDTRVGVVIPVFNRAQTLVETLAHVVAQVHQPAKLVVVDDGSSDGSADAAEQWLQAHQPEFDWQVVRAPHRHVAVARNIGFAAVKHLPLVTFLDSDDFWPADFLHRVCAVFAASPAAVAVSTDRDVDGPDRRFVDPDLRGITADPELWLIRYDAGIASCSVLDSRVVEQVGGWKEGETAGEDFLLFAAVAKLGDWLHAPGLPVFFNRHMADTRIEQLNLSRSDPMKHWTWAELAEREFKNHPGTGADRRQAMMQAVAARWTSAGNHFVRKRMFTRARDAYARAMANGGDSASLALRHGVCRVLAG